MERLQKLIAHSGIASRRAAEDLIRDGRVTVDGTPAHLGQKIEIETAVVEVDGIRLPVRPDLIYLLLYKPVGVVSTADDPQGRQTVVDLVDAGVRVYPVGRLDADSEGLLLLTNDGDLT
ncbi:MAG: pseudouridine synthase, partial [Actinobacteria bacterium]|nr:pseudouridine synthase [Actinomycetota bacterium]